MSRPRASSRKARCQRLSLRIGPSKAIRRAGMGIVPSPRGHANDDFAYEVVGVSVAREGLTLGRVGA